MKAPAFSLTETIIIETKTGITGMVIKDDNGYSVRIPEDVNLTEAKRHALAKRMRSWYYYNHVKGK